MLLCPCCLKGSHGKHVSRVASARGLPPYDVLLHTLHAICEREIATPPSAGVRGKRRATAQVRVVADEAMLSPKNSYLVMTKRAAATRPAAALAEAPAECVPCDVDASAPSSTVSETDRRWTSLSLVPLPLASAPPGGSGSGTASDCLLPGSGDHTTVSGQQLLVPSTAVGVACEV